MFELRLSFKNLGLGISIIKYDSPLTSDKVSRLGLSLESTSSPVFSSLGLECLRSRLDLEGYRSRSRALCLKTLHELFVYEV